MTWCNIVESDEMIVAAVTAILARHQISGVLYYRWGNTLRPKQNGWCSTTFSNLFSLYCLCLQLRSNLFFSGLNISLASTDWPMTSARLDEKHLSLGIGPVLYERYYCLTVTQWFWFHSGIYAKIHQNKLHWDATYEIVRLKFCRNSYIDNVT